MLLLLNKLTAKSSLAQHESALAYDGSGRASDVAVQWIGGMCRAAHLLPPQVVAPEVVHEQRVHDLQLQRARGLKHSGVKPLQELY